MNSIRRAAALLALIAASGAHAHPHTGVVCDVLSNLSNISMGRTMNQSPGVYGITSNTGTYSAGQAQTLTLTGGNMAGVIFVATTLDGTAHGTFTPTSFLSAMSECAPLGSRVSHNSNWGSTRTSVAVNWTAPATNVGDIYIRAYVLSGTRGNTASQQFYRLVPGSGAHLLTAVNAQPTLTATAVTPRAGDAAATTQIATAGDDQPPNTLTATIDGMSSATRNGVTLSNLAIASGGAVSASVLAACNASDAAFTLRVTDGSNAFDEETVNVTVGANVPPSLAYPTTNVVFGEVRQVSPSSVVDSGSVTGFSLQDPGTFAGSATVDGTGAVSLGAAAPVGNHTIVVAAADNCTATGTGNLALNVARAATSLAIDDAPASSVNTTNVAISQALSVTAPGAGTPSGTIAVTGTATTGCTITLPDTQCTLSFTASGNQTVQASYAGDTNFVNATAPPISHTVTPAANLSITKDNGRDALVSGSVVDYLLAVRNAGPDAVVAAPLLDPAAAGLGSVAWTCTPVPPATCPAPSGNGSIDVDVSLASGEQLGFTVTGTVTANPGATISNNASIDVPAGTTDLVPANNAASDNDPVVANVVFANGFEN